MEHIAKVIVILLTALVFFPSSSRADWREFIPRAYENGAFLELNGSYESDKSQPSGLASKDLFIREKLSVYSIGYSYHPNFIQYQITVSTALKQEKFESSGAGTSTDVWKNAAGIEYDAALSILPNHPYNLRLYAQRYEPLYKEEFATNVHNVLYNRGAIFEYKKRPFFLNISYIDSSTESSFGTTDVEHLHAAGLYYKEFKSQQIFTVSPEFDLLRFSSSSGQTGDSHRYALGNTVALGWMRLNSSVSQYDSSQNGPLNSLRTNAFSWSEYLNANLPLNFKPSLSYRYTKNSLTTGATDTTPETRLSDTEKELDLNVEHQLYDSLRSTYTFSDSSSSSANGTIDSISNSFATVYTKTIPWGRLLAGLNLSRTVLDTTGQPVVTNERHTSAVPGSFVLALQQPDPATIQVFLKSPVSPFELILLDENIHYTVTPLGNTFQINLLTVPPPFIVPGTFDFIIAYSLVPEHFKLQTDFAGFNINFHLFNDLVNPYYAYGISRARVLSGNFSGIPIDSTSNTVGILLQKLPYHALAEYQRVDANASPYTQWKGEVGYNNEIAEATTLYMTATYLDVNYSQGTGLEPGPGFTEKSFSATSGILKQFFTTNLYLSASGSYIYIKGPATSTGYTLSSALHWKVGKLDISMAGNLYNAESKATNATVSKRLHELYYLNVRRRLF